ncbi:hypothetical protein HK104_009121 [Borealophlyctis nickersoniae]|nr:hypothetical protein HK104_009121 [Borealophlyctis nickersoniae]
MEERIAAFRAEEESRFEQLQRQAYSDREHLWATICSKNADRIAAAQIEPTPSAGREAEVPTPELVVGSARRASSLKATSFLQGGSPSTHVPSLRNRRPSLLAASPALTMLSKRPEGLVVTAEVRGDKEDADTSSPPIPPTVPECGETEQDSNEESHGDVEDAKKADVAPKKVHFADGEKTERVAIAKKRAQEDEDDIFDLEGVGRAEVEVSKYRTAFDSDSDYEEEGKHNLTQSYALNRVSAHNITPPFRTADTPATEPELPVNLLSSSVPISIPRSFRGSFVSRSPIDPVPDAELDTLAVNGAEDGEEEETFIAPHILSARTYTEDDVFKRYRPSSRRKSVAI